MRKVDRNHRLSLRQARRLPPSETFQRIETSVHANVSKYLNTKPDPFASPESNTTGSNNIALGNNSGINATIGNFNIYIGNPGVAAETNTIKIGTSFVQTKTFIAGIRGATTGVANAVSVVIDSAGQLGTTSSSRRYKEESQDMAESSSGLMKLRPVTFRYTKAYANGDRPVQPGLIAEEVFEVYPELVVHDSNGEIETVQYQKLIPMLLNELQKQERELKDQEKQIADLKRRVELLETDRVPKIAQMK